MKREYGKYLLAKISFGGRLTKDNFIASIKNPSTLPSSETHVYTFSHYRREDFTGKKPKFVYANLIKYMPEANVDIYQEDTKEEAGLRIPRMIKHTNPFVYIPEFSGIAYLQTADINGDKFIEYFNSLVRAKYGDFFVDCKIESIADLVHLAERFSELKVIHKIDANVRPPNPFYGDCWKSLKEYIINRNAIAFHIKEESGKKSTDGINSSIPEISRKFLELNAVEGEKNTLTKLLPSSDNKHVLKDLGLEKIGDAAVFMAADGYGRARVYGDTTKKSIVVDTKDNQYSFTYKRIPEPNDLYEEASRHFKKISEERNWRHD